jgi:AraC-like DNA-binding protein
MGLREIKVTSPESTVCVKVAEALQLPRLKPGIQLASQMQLAAGQWETRKITVDPTALSYSMILRKVARIAQRPGRESTKISSLERARQRAQQYVDKYLRDPGLSVDAIAVRLNCTTRYLQKAFQESGQTLRDYIWHQRLSRCYRDLTDPKLSGLNITDIALSWGFNSVTHFSEAFRKRFGLSPSAVRQLASEPPRTI